MTRYTCLGRSLIIQAWGYDAVTNNTYDNEQNLVIKNDGNNNNDNAHNTTDIVVHSRSLKKRGWSCT